MSEKSFSVARVMITRSTTMADETSGIVEPRETPPAAGPVHLGRIDQVGRVCRRAQRRRGGTRSAAPRQALARLTASIGLVTSQLW